VTNRQGGLPCPFNSIRKKALRSTLVATRLNQDIDHVTILIDGTPEILPLTLDSDEYLIRVPRVTQPALPPLERTSVVGTKLEAPLADGFVGNSDAALRKEILDVPKAQAKTVRQPDGVADDFSRKSISSVAGRLAVHRAIPLCQSPPQLDSTGDGLVGTIRHVLQCSGLQRLR